MATVETRGYVSRFEKKVSPGGKEYCRFTLASQQKRKEKGVEVKERVYFTCVDFSGKEPPGLHPDDRDGSLTAYVGIKGYLTVTNWAKDGKGGSNLDVTVTEYESLDQKHAGGQSPQQASVAPPEDPFALTPGTP